MTLADLFAGQWTAWQLVRELLPIALMAIGTALVGYERGYHAGFLKGADLNDRVDRLEATVAAGDPAGPPQEPTP